MGRQRELELALSWMVLQRKRCSGHHGHVRVGRSKMALRRQTQKQMLRELWMRRQER